MSETRRLAEEVLRLARGQEMTIATAESCTGGLVAAALTSVPGSSAAMDRGFVTYSNPAKTKMLGVPSSLIARHGAVSQQVARAMAEGALAEAGVSLTVAVTGVAGPDGGTVDKPIGLVHFAAARRSGPTLHVERRFGDLERDEIRRRSVIEALRLLLEAAGRTEVA